MIWKPASELCAHVSDVKVAHMGALMTCPRISSCPSSVENTPRLETRAAAGKLTRENTRA